MPIEMSNGNHDSLEATKEAVRKHSLGAPNEVVRKHSLGGANETPAALECLPGFTAKEQRIIVR